MDHKDKWVDDILTSIDKIDRAQPRENLLDDILNELPQTKIIPLRKLYWVAAASVILVSLNIASIATSDNNSSDNEFSDNRSICLTTDYSLYE